MSEAEVKYAENQDPEVDRFTVAKDEE